MESARAASTPHHLATLTKPNRVVNRLRSLRINVDNCDSVVLPKRVLRGCITTVLWHCRPSAPPLRPHDTS